MGSVDDFAQITIDPAAAVPTLPDPGIAAVLSGTVYSGAGTGWNTAEIFRVYDDQIAVLADWGATTPEALAGAAWFAQDPQRKLIVGKYSVAPALIYTITVTGGADSTVYSFLVNGQLVTYTSDSDFDSGNDKIVTGLKAAFDLLAISGITSSLIGSAASKKLQLAGTAGLYFYPELVDSTGTDFGPSGNARLALAATTLEPGTAVATQIQNLRNANDSWYYLLNPYPGLALGEALAAALLSVDKKVLIQLDPTSGIVSDAVSLPATDLPFVLKGLNNTRAAVIYHGKPVTMADAAMAGSRAGDTPGTQTYAFAVLSGIPTTKLNDTQRNNLKAKNCNWYEGYGSLADGSNAVASLQQGKTCGGMWLDERVYRDTLAARLQLAAFTLLQQLGAQGRKLRGDDKGAQAMWGALDKVFLADTLGDDAPLDAYTLGIPLQANRTQSDKDNRILGDFPFTCTYSSAVHKVTIRGVITV